MEIESLLAWSAAILFTVLTVAPFYLRYKRTERRLADAEAKAFEQGLHEPATLHPIVHAGTCIGIGNCISVCPEGDVIGIRDGQARPIAPAKCIGHGLCERACPVSAIQLVFGTEQRGVDIPRIKANFETNAPGIYIIGELGGMGLIRNAFEQGRQCIEAIRKEKRNVAPDVLDALIVGCGPAGLSASLHCLHAGMRFRTVEREEIGGAVCHYPRKKLVMTAPVKVPGYGTLKVGHIGKEELIEIWQDVVTKTDLKVQTGETVTRVERRSDGTFDVVTNAGSYHTARVILAIGRRGVPRKLDVPGENLSKVCYALKEPEAYQGDRVMVVGGGDSAIEAALALSEQPGNEVTISYRRDAFSRIKPGNRSRADAAIASGRINVLWSTRLTEITPEAVTYRNGDPSGASLANSALFIFAGGQLPTAFLKECGVEIDTKFGQPA